MKTDSPNSIFGDPKKLQPFDRKKPLSSIVVEGVRLVS